MFLNQNLIHRILGNGDLNTCNMKQKMIPCVSIWRDLGAFTHSLIHSFTTSLVKVLEDTTDILPRSPAFLCHTASCSQLRLSSNFWLWLLKSPCPLRESGSWWPTVPSWPLLLNDWPYCGGSIWHTTLLSSQRDKLWGATDAQELPWDPETGTFSWHHAIAWLRPLFSLASMIP